VPETLTLPGFVNAHSHAFQRALRGRAEGAEFWAWREQMLPEQLAGARTTKADLLRAVRTRPAIAPRMLTFLAITVLAVNMLGDGLRDTLDPRVRKRL